MKKLCALLIALLVFSMLGGVAYAAEEKIESLKLGKEVNFTLAQFADDKFFKIVMPADGTLTIDLESDITARFYLSDANNSYIMASDLNVSLGSGDYRYNSNRGVHITINSIENRSVSSTTYSSLKKGTYYLEVESWGHGSEGNITLTASSDAKPAAEKPAPSKPTGDPKVSISIPLKKGQSFQLGTVLSNTGGEQPAWKSSDKAIATVSSKGLVKAVKKGDAIITVTVVGKKHSIAVVVTD